ASPVRVTARPARVAYFSMCREVSVGIAWLSDGEYHLHTASCRPLGAPACPPGRAETCTTPARPSSRSARARRGGPATVHEMGETSPYVVDVGGAEFDAAVLERSHETPVLVDF